MSEVRRRDVQYEPVRDTLLSVLAASLIIWATAVARTPSPAVAPPKINGAYDVIFAGPGPGTGKAVVTPKTVKIDGTMTDPQGNQVDFSAAKLAIDGSTYRFRGTGMLGSSPATISGRLDPDDTNLKQCRLTATFLAADGRAGRIVGARK